MPKQNAAINAATLVPLALALATGPLIGAASGSATSSARTTSATAAKAKVACAAVLSACPEAGCAHTDTPDAVTNELKRRLPAGGSPKLLTLDDFKRLQDDEIAAFGDDRIEPTEAERSKSLHQLSIGGGKVSEGDLVQVVGFLVGTSHANSGESVNCKLTGSANNDFHITIADDPSSDEFAGIVVEMTPQVRKKAWTLKALAAAEALDRPVLVIGQLFYDNKHHVNDDPENPQGGDPKRFSLFEVHPVTAFFVCKTAEQCDPNRPGDWLALEDPNALK
jgi:hypothetical protein